MADHVPRLEVTCCARMHDLTQQDRLICITENSPFTKTKLKKPVVTIQSAGGHDAVVQIKFCPFCGAKIEIKQSS